MPGTGYWGKPWGGIITIPPICKKMVRIYHITPEYKSRYSERIINKHETKCCDIGEVRTGIISCMPPPYGRGIPCCRLLIFPFQSTLSNMINSIKVLFVRNLSSLVFLRFSLRGAKKKRKKSRKSGDDEARKCTKFSKIYTISFAPLFSRPLLTMIAVQSRLISPSQRSLILNARSSTSRPAARTRLVTKAISEVNLVVGGEISVFYGRSGRSH